MNFTKRMFYLWVVTLLTSAHSAFAATSVTAGPLKIDQAFQVRGEISNFYGREKSAESVMWVNALKVCEDLGKASHDGLLLNRLSAVATETTNTRSTATATFTCVTVGLGD